jgi:hypothetical protein
MQLFLLAKYRTKCHRLICRLLSSSSLWFQKYSNYIQLTLINAIIHVKICTIHILPGHCYKEYTCFLNAISNVNSHFRYKCYELWATCARITAVIYTAGTLGITHQFKQWHETTTYSFEEKSPTSHPESSLLIEPILCYSKILTVLRALEATDIQNVPLVYDKKYRTLFYAENWNNTHGD